MMEKGKINDVGMSAISSLVVLAYCIVEFPLDFK